MPPTYGQGWGEVYQDLTLPSGAICQIRSIQMEDLADLGIIDQLDFLGQLVDTHQVQRVKGSNKPSDRPKKKPTKAELAAADEQNTMELLKDKSKFKTMIELIDKIVCAVVVQPAISSAYRETGEERNEQGDVKKLYEKIPYSDRQSGVIYSDTINLEDKMEIFDVGFSGVKKMSNFRNESGEAVGDVDDQPGQPLQTE